MTDKAAAADRLCGILHDLDSYLFEASGMLNRVGVPDRFRRLNVDEIKMTIRLLRAQ